MRTAFERKASDELERRLAETLRGNGPVIVGPWVNEVGPEVMFWTPFLRWVVERFEVDPSRLTAISRGGVASWYAGIADGYREIFDLWDPETFRRRTELRWQVAGGMKQERLTDWDRLVLRELADGQPVDAVLHPIFMWRFFRRFWRGGLSRRQVDDHVRYRRLEPPLLDGHPRLANLPERFIAVAFYYRPSFPKTPANEQFVADAVASLAEHTHVVLLDTAHQFDEHHPPGLEVSSRVLMPLAGAPPAENLALQSGLAARADAWVGTYGGRAHIAVAHGCPLVAFSSDPSHFLPSQGDTLRRFGAATGAPVSLLETGSLRDLALLATARARARVA